MKTSPLRLLRSGALAAALFYAVPAQADDILWAGATNGALNWNTDANWVGGVYPNADTNRADLRKDWASAVINLSAPVTVNGIFSDDTGATGDTTLVISNGGSAANTLTLAGTNPFVSVTGGSTLTNRLNLQAAGGFTKTGNGFLLLAGSNSISGTLIVSEGTLTTASTNALSADTLIRVDPAAVFRVNNEVRVAGLNDNAGSGGSVGNASGGGKTLNISGSGTYSFNGNFTTGGSNKVGLRVSGAGATQILGGDNTANTGYQSVTTSGGTLVFAKQNSIFQGLAAGAVVNTNTPVNSGINVTAGGTVALGVGDAAAGYFDETAIATFLDSSHMGASSSGGGFRNGSILGFDTANATGGTFTYSNALANIGTSTGNGFAKLGAGTLVLEGTNTYTGVTQVREGTLAVDGSTAAGAVTVAAGATLGGSGVIAGATTVQSGGTLAPGNSPGVLSFGSDLTLEGAVVMELNGLTRATQYDGIDVGGQLNYGGTLTLNFGSVFADGDSFNLFDFASTSGTFDSITFAGAYIGALANDSGVWTGNIGGQDFSYLDSTGQLNVVPEPSTSALCALAAGSWGALRLLRRRARPALSRC
jgi:autotransporter-associated beta strand protein